MNDYLHECSSFVAKNPSSSIGDRVDARDPEAILELGFRYLSGCGMRVRSIQGALFALDMLTDEFASGEHFVGDGATTHLRAIAHSAAAHAYWQDWLTTDPAERAQIHADLHRFERPFNPDRGPSRYDALVFAGLHADSSARLGLVSAAVLFVGFGFKDVAEAHGMDPGFTPLNLRYLWDALAKREGEIVAEWRRREGKVAKEAHAYVCAAEGCRVEGLHRAALRSCSGRCPPDLKPRYCSKECQVRDWPRHKKVCKPGRQGKPRTIEDKEQTADFMTFLNGSHPDTEAAIGTHTEVLLGGELLEDKVHHGPEHAIKLPGAGPGGISRIISNTLAPTELRKFREEIMKSRGREVAF